MNIINIYEYDIGLNMIFILIFAPKRKSVGACLYIVHVTQKCLSQPPSLSSFDDTPPPAHFFFFRRAGEGHSGG